MYYNLKISDVYCAIVDLSKVFDRIDTSLLCDKRGEAYLAKQVIALTDFIGKKNFVCTPYEGQLSDEWNVINKVRRGGISSGTLFNFYLNDVIFDLSKLSAGCTLICSKVDTFGYADN